MITHPLMKCGHVAQGHDQDKNPVCVICIGLTTDAEIVAEQISLDGRFARCAYIHDEEQVGIPSSYDLAFFEYRGPGSPYATTMCTCGYTEGAHIKVASGEIRNMNVCANFTPRGPAEFDTYYDGCRGWD